MEEEFWPQEDMSNYPKLGLSPAKLLSNHYGERHAPYSELLKSLSVLYSTASLTLDQREEIIWIL